MEIEVDKVQWRESGDGRVQVRIAGEDGAEVILNLSRDKYLLAVAILIDASSAYPIPRGTGHKDLNALSADAIQVGKIEDTDDLFITFQKGGSWITVQLPPEAGMAVYQGLGDLLPVPRPEAAPLH